MHNCTCTIMSFMTETRIGPCAKRFVNGCRNIHNIITKLYVSVYIAMIFLYKLMANDYSLYGPLAVKYSRVSSTEIEEMNVKRRRYKLQ